MGIELLRHIYFRIPVLIRLLLTILVVMLSFGILIHFIEPEQFPSIFDGIWWAFVTGATVGYGDFVPLSQVGRMIGILLMLTGAGLITFYISLFASTTIKYEKELSEGVIPYKGSEHIICIGWNERTKQLIKMALNINPKVEIVLIDHTLQHISYQHTPIHFIHGDPTEDLTLKQANINKANQIIITADTSQNEQQADKLTILSTVAARGNNEKVPIISEILTKRQIINAKRAGASTIIRPNDFISTLLYHELYKKESAKPFDALLALLQNQHFTHLSLPASLVDCSFLHIMFEFKKSGYLIIGLIRDGKWMMNPGHDLIIYKTDILIGLHSWENQ